jgi:hypothetical protein
VSIRSLLAADSACKSTSDTPQEFSFLARLLVFFGRVADPLHQQRKNEEKRKKEWDRAGIGGSA